MINVIANISSVSYNLNYVNYSPCVSGVSLTDYLHSCFILKHDCENIFVEDKTDYLGNEALVTLELISIVHKRGNVNLQNCGPALPIELSLGSRNVYEAIYGNGNYMFTWRFTITIPSEVDGEEPTIYTFEVSDCIYLECCKDDIIGLINLIKSKISTLGCKINDFELIGRNTNKLYDTLFALNNALFLLSTSKERSYCSDAELVNCYLGSIKNIC